MNFESTPSVPTSRRIGHIVRNVAIAVIAMISVAACSPGAADQPTAAESSDPTMSTTASPTPEATAAIGPGRGIGAFAGCCRRT